MERKQINVCRTERERELASEPQERKTNPEREREFERTLVAKGERETWRNQRESIIHVLPLHLPVTPILPGSYCRRYFTSCA